MADILHELTIAAPAEKVFRARTEKEGLSGWWTLSVTAQPKPPLRGAPSPRLAADGQLTQIGWSRQPLLDCNAEEHHAHR